MDGKVFTDHIWFEDFSVDEVFQFGAWEMRKEDMVDFACIYDPEPFHVDEVQAVELGWGGLIASGLQLASIWRRLSKDAFPNTRTVISPGWDDLRWLVPVIVGDVLASKSRVAETRLLASRPGEGLIKMSNEVFRVNGEVVMKMTTNWFVLSQYKEI